MTGPTVDMTDTERIVDDVRSQVRSHVERLAGQVERLAALVDYWRDRALTAEAGQPITEPVCRWCGLPGSADLGPVTIAVDDGEYEHLGCEPAGGQPPLSCTGLADERVAPDAESS